jgi:putative phosphoribosyl transferase
LRIPGSIIDEVAAEELEELKPRERLYRGSRPPPDLRGRTVILVDDGLATGRRSEPLHGLSMDRSSCLA